MTTMLRNAIDEDELETVCREKQALVESLPAIQAELAAIDQQARIESEQFSALREQHDQRVAHFQQQRRVVLAKLGSVRAAKQWLASNAS